MPALEDSFHLGIKVLLRNIEEKFLLLERAHKTRGTYWDIPGGRIHKNESITEALKREIEEETGLKNIERAIPFMMFLTDIRIGSQKPDVGLILSVYQYDLKSSFTPRLSAEHIHFDWFSPQEAAQLLKQYPSGFIEKLAKLK